MALGWLNEVDVKGSGVGCCVGFFCVLFGVGLPQGFQCDIPFPGFSRRRKGGLNREI